MAHMNETSDFLYHIIFQCKTLSERYHVASTFLLSCLFDTSYPELTAQAIAYTLTDGMLRSLSHRLEQLADADKNMSKSVSAITSCVSLLGSLRYHAGRQARCTPIHEVDLTYASVTDDTLRAILGEIGEEILAPSLENYVEAASGLRVCHRHLFHIVDRQSSQVVHSLMTITRTLHQLSAEEHLDQRYVVLADALVAHVKQHLSLGKHGNGKLDAVASYICSASQSSFIMLIAQLFAEFYAGSEGEAVDLVPMMHAALHIVKHRWARNEFV